MERTTRSQQGEVAHLPFAGLGHDLAPVKRQAACLWLIPVVPRNVELAFVVPCYEALPTLAGFGLLVALGREIRGR